MREADIFVLTSHHENFGIAVVEAMANGLPVIVSNCVNISKEIESSQAGLVTSVEPHHIATALDKLLESDQLRKEMGRCGRELVTTHYSWESVVKSLTAAYENIIKLNRQM